MIDKVTMGKKLGRCSGHHERIRAFVHPAEALWHRAEILGQRAQECGEASPIDVECGELIADQKAATTSPLGLELTIDDAQDGCNPRRGGSSSLR